MRRNEKRTTMKEVIESVGMYTHVIKPKKNNGKGSPQDAFYIAKKCV